MADRFSKTTQPHLMFVCLLAMGVALLTGGCIKIEQSSGQSLTELTKIPTDEELKRELDGVLEWTYNNRHLNTKEHATWQILHGVLTYKQKFMVRHEGKMVPAVDHLLTGGYLNGWDAVPGTEFEKTGRRGLRILMAEGTGTGQGHHDQWLAVLAQCKLKPEQTIRVGGKDFTMNDYVAQVKWDLPRNLDKEFSWTLIGLTNYLPSDAKWTASDGRDWSIERLVQLEAEHAISEGACGGTHRLIGLSMALEQYQLEEKGRELQGPWILADRQVKAAIELAKTNQNGDGSFSSRHFGPGGVSPDLSEVIGSSGHVLEFLALSLSNEQLQEPWVKRGVNRLCQLFRQTEEVPLKCGALYHATHALAIYRQRVYQQGDEY